MADPFTPTVPQPEPIQGPWRIADKGRVFFARGFVYMPFEEAWAIILVAHKPTDATLVGQPPNTVLVPYDTWVQRVDAGDIAPVEGTTGL